MEAKDLRPCLDEMESMACSWHALTWLEPGFTPVTQFTKFGSKVRL